MGHINDILTYVNSGYFHSIRHNFILSLYIKGDLMIPNSIAVLHY